MAEGLRGWTRPDMGRPTRFVMVRHGQTADSVRHLFSGSGGTDPELTELGHRQAQQAAQRVQESVAPGDFSVLFASPLRRTQQTAQYLAESLDLPVVTDDRLRECDFGEWEGYTMGEVLERYPTDAAAWMQDPECVPPGGESLAAVRRRLQSFREDVTAQFSGTNVLMVSHVTPIKSLLWEGLGKVDTVFYRLFLDLASISVAEFYRDGGSTVRLVNYGGGVVS